MVLIVSAFIRLTAAVGNESREMLGIVAQLRDHGLDHSPATRTRRSSRMRGTLQLVVCRDAGQEETVTEVMTRNKHRPRLAPLGWPLAEAHQLRRTLPPHLLQPPGDP